jgi:hypothetical protein
VSGPFSVRGRGGERSVFDVMLTPSPVTVFVSASKRQETRAGQDHAMSHKARESLLGPSLAAAPPVPTAHATPLYGASLCRRCLFLGLVLAPSRSRRVGRQTAAGLGLAG